jgi:hypothetical protein
MALNVVVALTILDLNPVVLFFALFIGERIAGLLGVFLAIPIAGMIGQLAMGAGCGGSGRWCSQRVSCPAESQSVRSALLAGP